MVIKNVGFGLSGNFSCEVTADAPLFSTGTAYNHLQVVGKLHVKRLQARTVWLAAAASVGGGSLWSK